MTDLMAQKVYTLLRRIKEDGYVGEWLAEIDEVMDGLIPDEPTPMESNG
jgi:hypothetical protein